MRQKKALYATVFSSSLLVWWPSSSSITLIFSLDLLLLLTCFKKPFLLLLFVWYHNGYRELKLSFSCFLPTNVNCSSVISLWPDLASRDHMSFFSAQVSIGVPCSAKLVLCPACLCRSKSKVISLPLLQSLKHYMWISPEPRAETESLEHTDWHAKELVSTFFQGFCVFTLLLSALSASVLALLMKKVV